MFKPSEAVFKEFEPSLEAVQTLDVVQTDWFNFKFSQCSSQRAI